MGQSRRRSDRVSTPARKAIGARAKPQLILLTGFGRFGREHANPSWEIARLLDGEVIGGLTVKSVRLPVNCEMAARRIIDSITRFRPCAVLGLGQAGGRPALSVERVAINLAQRQRQGAPDLRADPKPVVPGGPDAYFARFPIGPILRTLGRRGIPAASSLTAGAYACNAAMYAALHTLRQRPEIPTGFIHLPYDTVQAAHHPATPSMPLGVMEQAVRAVIAAVAHAALRRSAQASRARST